MPTRGYICSKCEYSFEIVQSFKEKRKRKCPNCKKLALDSIVYIPTVQIIGEPTTIGQQAERNAKKFGKYGVEDKENQRQANQISKDEVLGIKKPKKRPFWRKTDKINPNLAKMNREQTERYIMTGETPSFAKAKNNKVK